MNDRWLVSSFTASSLIHLSLIPVAALLMHAKPLKPVNVPIELIEVTAVEQPKTGRVPPPPPAPKPKPQNISAPKVMIQTGFRNQPASADRQHQRRHQRETTRTTPQLASLPDNTGAAKAGWNVGSPRPEAEGSAAGAGNLFGKGDVGVVGGSGVSKAVAAARGASGLGRGTKGDGTGGGGLEVKALSGLARPLGGYQVKPRYPESAKRAGVQGVTTLRVRVLETGRVGEVLVEQSAGFRDLDLAAVDAVKKWLFEPAHQGKNPVSVWVLLPVKFELH